MSAPEWAEGASATFSQAIAHIIVLGMAWILSLAYMCRLKKCAGQKPQ